MQEATKGPIYTNVQVRRNVAIFYPEFERRGVRGGGIKGDKRDANLARSADDYTGALSKKQIRKIKRVIDTLIEGKKYRNQQLNRTQDMRRCLTFTTLTLSGEQQLSRHTDYWYSLKLYPGQKVKRAPFIVKIDQLRTIKRISDNWIKRFMLQWFFTKVRRRYVVNNMVWKAEKQKNGRIHFHILMDTYMNWRWLRDAWNEIQDHYGYLDSYQEKIKAAYPRGFEIKADWKIKKGKIRVMKPADEQLEYYKEQEKRGFKDANSTDIHSLQKVQDVGSYITKEFSKQQQTGVGGRIWGCSDHLKDATYYTEISEADNNKYWNQVWRYGYRFYDSDMCTVISLRDVPIPDMIRCRMEQHAAQFVN